MNAGWRSPAAAAVVAIGVLLRRLDREGRDPDRWEAEKIVEALAALRRHDYRRAINLAAMAVVGPARRDLANITKIEDTSSGFTAVHLSDLIEIYEELRDGKGSPALH
jgi:hypothetical protein